MRKAIGIALLLLFGAALARGQDAPGVVPENLVADSLRAPKKEGFFKKNYPDPLKAGLMSLVVPGSGQIYNKSWWKVPLVYGALGGMAYLIKYNNEQYHRLEDAYQASLRGEDHEFSGTAIDKPESLRNIRDSFDKNRQLSWVGFIAVYVLNGVEAFVNAHLKNFDIDDSLSFQVRPDVLVIPAGNGLQTTLGIGVSIPLNGARQESRLPITR